MSNTEKIVVRVKPSHPTGSRNRAWFKFWFEPAFVEVTPEQKKMIEEDAYLIILEKWTAFEQGLENEAANLDDGADAQSDDQTSDDSESDEDDGQADETQTAENVAWNDGAETSDGDDDGADAQSEGTEGNQTAEGSEQQSNQEEAAKPISRMNKAELIAGLEAKGKVAGTDFDPAASNGNLAVLLSSL